MILSYECERCGAAVELFRGDPSCVYVGPGGLLERIVDADTHVCKPRVAVE